MNKLLALALSASLVALPGCTHYTLTPDRPASLPVSADKPLPLTVGIVLDGPGQTTISGMPPSGGVKDQMNATVQSIGPRFAEALTRSNAFSRVVYPLAFGADAAQQGVDLVISARFGYGFRQDSLQVPKIIFVIFTGLFTGALMSETSYHDASGALSVREAGGAAVKSYDEKISVEASSMVSMFAEISTGEKGPPAAVDNLVAKLVQAIIADRPLYERLRRAPPPVRELDAENPQTPSGGAAQPWWKQ